MVVIPDHRRDHQPQPGRGMEGHRGAGGGQVAAARGRRPPAHHARLLPRDQESNHGIHFHCKVQFMCTERGVLSVENFEDVIYGSPLSVTLF